MKITQRSVLVAALSFSMTSFAGASDMKMAKEATMGMETINGMPMQQSHSRGNSDEVHKTTGVVKKVNKEKGTVTFSHAPVKSLNWSAMTMAFRVSDPALFEKLAVGNTVDFEFIKEGKGYVVTSAR